MPDLSILWNFIQVAVSAFLGWRIALWQSRQEQERWHKLQIENNTLAAQGKPSIEQVEAAADQARAEANRIFYLANSELVAGLRTDQEGLRKQVVDLKAEVHALREELSEKYKVSEDLRSQLLESYKTLALRDEALAESNHLCESKDKIITGLRVENEQLRIDIEKLRTGK